METNPTIKKRITEISASDLFYGILLFFSDRGFRENELRQFFWSLESDYPNAVTWLRTTETCTGPTYDIFSGFLTLMCAPSSTYRMLEFNESSWFRVAPSARPLIQSFLEKDGLLPQFEADFRRLAARFDRYLGPWPQRREECSTACSPGSAV